MIWFYRLFPVVMLLMPLVLTACVRPHRDARPDAVLLFSRLAVVTLGIVGLHAGVQFALETYLPASSVAARVWPIALASFGSVLVWLAFAGPALVARHPGWAPGAPGTLRAASLKPRHQLQPISSRAWRFGWAVFAVCVLVTAWALFEGAPVVLALGLVWWLGFAYFGARSTTLEPEPRDARGSAELARAYDSLRRFRARWFFVLGLGGTTLISIVAAVTAVRPPLGGWSGAVLGTALGVAGGVFGLVSSLRRARVNTLLYDLERG